MLEDDGEMFLEAKVEVKKQDLALNRTELEPRKTSVNFDPKLLNINKDLKATHIRMLKKYQDVFKWVKDSIGLKI